MDNHIRIVRFVDGAHVGDDVTPHPLYQWNYGQEIHFVGLTLPKTFEVHFTDETAHESRPEVGTDNVVKIPDDLMERAGTLTVYIFLHDTENDGTTKKMVWLKRKPKQKPEGVEPTPVQQDVITTAIAALNDGVERAEAAANGLEEALALFDSLGLSVVNGELNHTFEEG